ncbi:MAG TPA: protein translocase subunit SecF, partial [Propionibacteriaceae bacterium]|nr:protein translocase subunit SecF [Propionibacteriaceae bacterium]
MSQLVDETPVVPTARKMGLTHRLYTGDISYDFIGRRKLWYTISGALLVISLLALVFLRLNLGIEFKGGADFQAPVTVTSTTVDDVKAAVLGLDLPDMDDMSVVTLGDSTVRVQTRTLATEEVTLVRGALAELGGTTPENVAYNLIGASWGQQITSKAFMALGVFLVLVMLLIWGYFRDWKMSVAAIV